MLADRPGAAPFEDLAATFAEFATHEAVQTSPLYTRLSRAVAADADLLELASHATRTPVPNILLAAVHYLLLKGVPHPLAAYYPSVAGATAREDDPLPAFKSFCRDYRAEIIHLMQTRRVQTNEVNRCVLLMPAFAYVARREPGRALAVVEIGPSAGLNLLWDRYHYEYGNGQSAGALDAPLHLVTAARGSLRPPLPDPMPRVDFRLGLDLNPVRVGDEDAVLWLRALVWPEHDHRADRLARAIDIARQHDLELVSGNALDLLPGALARVPQDDVLCVLHSFVLNQFSEADRDQVSARLAAHSLQRVIYRVSIEDLNSRGPQLELRVYRDGALIEHRHLARVDSHGRWIEWLVDR